MADQKISALSPAAAVFGTYEFGVSAIAGVSSRKVTATQLRDFVRVPSLDNDPSDVLGGASTRFAKGYFGTSLVTPEVDTASATDLLLKRNAVTKLTLATALATFADLVSMPGCLTPSVDSGSATDLLLQRNGLTRLTLGSTDCTTSGGLSVTTNVGIATTPNSSYDLIIASAGTRTSTIVVASTYAAAALQIGMIFNPTFSASVVAIGSTVTGTIAAASTVPLYRQYNAGAPTLSAGAAITTLYAYYADDVTLGGTNYSLFLNRGNVALFGGAGLGGGADVISIHNANTNPTSNPANGGILYVTGGALTYRGSAGTVTPIAPA